VNVALSSSLRSLPPEETLARAKKMAARLGITRVTDVTRLDRVGVPVYVSVRPDAVPGSLCVNAGKGLRPIEAEVGAYMEAIEYAMAEAHRHPKPIAASARNVLDGAKRADAILDLAPKLGRMVRLDAPMDCVAMREITTGRRALVPAELVYLPYRPHARYRSVFGSSSNGLASGNTVREATVHGLCELIERDVTAFQGVRDTSQLVDVDGIEGLAGELVATVRDAGLELYVRSTKNAFGMPFFNAIIHDADSFSPNLLNGGYGCHPHRSIAFVRAVCEAAQSRLSFIHGGRDDLVDHHARFRGWSHRAKRAFVARVVRGYARGERIRYRDVDDHSDAVTTIDAAERFVLSRLRACGFDEAYALPLTRSRDLLQVVRVIVPRLEVFGETIRRVGPRLRDHAREHARAS
jgi:ribosomal protein S12 methylthiotransferase accessory factor